MPNFQIVNPDGSVMQVLSAVDRLDAISQAKEILGHKAYCFDTSDPLVAKLTRADAEVTYLLRETPYDDVQMASLAHELRRQLLDMKANGELYATISADVIAGARVTLRQLADVAQHILAWDSLTFLDVLEVDNSGNIHAIPTRGGWRRIEALGGVGDDEDFTGWDS